MQIFGIQKRIIKSFEWFEIQGLLKRGISGLGNFAIAFPIHIFLVNICGE
jgi:hypothetical protein